MPLDEIFWLPLGVAVAIFILYFAARTGPNGMANTASPKVAATPIAAPESIVLFEIMVSSLLYWGLGNSIVVFYAFNTSRFV